MTVLWPVIVTVAVVILARALAKLALYLGLEAEDLGLMQGFPPPPEQRVDASNGIFGVPYNRWSYQHMRRIYPSAPVQPAKQPIHLKRGINADIETLLVKREDGSPSNLLAFLSETYTDAFVVLQEDTVVYERYLNGMTPDTPTR